MRQMLRTLLLHGSASLGLLAVAGAAAAAAAADIVPSTWQHHKITMHYFGITSLYSCDGLEEQVRAILLHFGARKDLKVNANGCPRGPESPSRSAWVLTDFYTLAPAESTSADGTVRGYWATRELNGRRPYFMGEGDCELVEQMKDLLSAGFSMRDVRYRTECIPHSTVIDGFNIKGQVLVSAPAAITG